MAAAVSLAAGARSKLVGLVSLGHFHSHFCAFVLPPLFPLLKDAFDVGYVGLGTTVALYSLISGLGQTPMGLLVDRYGGRPLLVAGLLLQSAAFVLMAAADAFWQIALLAALAGLGNSVFHPADYAILAARVDNAQLGRAISVHSFSGYVGWAAAPATMLAIAGVAGWPTALLATGLAGFAITALIVHHAGLAPAGARPASPPARQAARTWNLLSSRAILLMLAFFFVSTVAGGGLQTFGAVALMERFGLDIVAANTAVTGFLVASAVGVLAGGWIADKTRRHAPLTAVALLAMAACAAVLPARALSFLAIAALMAIAGFAYGVISPLRDIQVRAVTPDGMVGAAFGFVSTGLGLGAALSPVICGWLMDLGKAEAVFYLAAFMSLASIVAILAERKQAG